MALTSSAVSKRNFLPSMKFSKYLSYVPYCAIQHDVTCKYLAITPLSSKSLAVIKTVIPSTYKLYL